MQLRGLPSHPREIQEHHGRRRATWLLTMPTKLDLRHSSFPWVRRAPNWERLNAFPDLSEAKKVFDNGKEKSNQKDKRARRHTLVACCDYQRTTGAMPVRGVLGSFSVQVRAQAMIACS